MRGRPLCRGSEGNRVELPAREMVLKFEYNSRDDIIERVIIGFRKCA